MTRTCRARCACAAEAAAEEEDFGVSRSCVVALGARVGSRSSSRRSISWCATAKLPRETAASRAARSAAAAARADPSALRTAIDRPKTLSQPPGVLLLPASPCHHQASGSLEPVFKARYVPDALAIAQAARDLVRADASLSVAAVFPLPALVMESARAHSHY